LPEGKTLKQRGKRYSTAWPKC